MLTPHRSFFRNSPTRRDTASLSDCRTKLPHINTSGPHISILIFVFIDIYIKYLMQSPRAAFKKSYEAKALIILKPYRIC